jgi:hypothetical protein
MIQIQHFQIFLPNRLEDRAGADARVDVSDLTEAVLGKKR